MVQPRKVYGLTSVFSRLTVWGFFINVFLCRVLERILKYCNFSPVSQKENSKKREFLCYLREVWHFEHLLFLNFSINDVEAMASIGAHGIEGVAPVCRMVVLDGGEGSQNRLRSVRIQLFNPFECEGRWIPALLDE